MDNQIVKLLPYIMIAGPTASGKSRFAVELAKRVNGVVINADSMQIYKDLSVLTARPRKVEMEGVPHYLFGILDGAHRASVAEWLEQAAKVISLVRSSGKLPIIVGGTGMYLRAAQHGIAPVPDVPSQVHQYCIDLHCKIGGKRFRDRLAKLDPEIAFRFEKGDRQRLIRAMGVVLATERPLSWWQQQPHIGAFSGKAVKIAIVPARQILYSQINRRFDAMFDGGAVQEVAALLDRKLDASLPLMKALGVTPISSFLRKEVSEEDAKLLAKRDSRRYAKRQLTWIRNNFNAQIVEKKKFSESLFENIFPFIR